MEYQHRKKRRGERKEGRKEKKGGKKRRGERKEGGKEKKGGKKRRGERKEGGKEKKGGKKRRGERKEETSYFSFFPLKLVMELKSNNINKIHNIITENNSFGKLKMINWKIKKQE